MLFKDSSPAQAGFKAALFCRPLLVAQVVHPALVQERQSVPKEPLQSVKHVFINCCSELLFLD